MKSLSAAHAVRALSHRIFVIVRGERFLRRTKKTISFAFYPISKFLRAINRAVRVIFLTLILGLSAKSSVALCQLT